MVKLLLLTIIITVISLAVFSVPTVKRDLAYKFNLSGDSTRSCCNVDDILRNNGEFDESANIAIFNGDVIDYPKTSLAYENPVVSNEIILGTTTSDGKEKWVEVDLEKQWLSAWEGNQVVMQFPISSGKWSPTPKGTFEIWYKTRRQSMIGGSQTLGTYYNLPNVPNNMFFYKGYAIHGAYWHNNFGQPMSHGCVNSPLANVAQLFEWAGPTVPAGQNVARASADNPGTRVYVH